MQKWLLIISLAAISCKGNEQKAAAQPVVFNTRTLTSGETIAYQDSFKYFMDTVLNNAGFSGGILVAKNGTVLYEHYQGFSDVSQRVAINDSTPVHVASTSKTFTSHAILQLMQQGKLKLTDTLQQFFPDFPYPGMSIRHLLTHTSGLQNYSNFLPAFGWNKKQIVTNIDVVDFIINKKPPLAYKTGSRFSYCNTNFTILAVIVEKISGMPFPEYVMKNIFEPAGMTHSFVFSINDTSRYLPSFAPGKRIFNFDYLDAIYGDKNVYTTCRDLLAYDAAIRNHILLDSATYEMAWEPLETDRHYRDSFERYGLGWRLKVWPNGNKIVYHNGWWHGNNSIFQRVIQDTAVIIVTGNVFNRRIYHVPHAANIFRPYYEESDKEEKLPETDSAAAKPEKSVLQKSKQSPKQAPARKSKADSRKQSKADLRKNTKPEVKKKKKR